MTDTRSAKELEVIKLICSEENIDPDRMLSDQTCDMSECARRVRTIRAVREAMQPRILYQGS